MHVLAPFTPEGNIGQSVRIVRVAGEACRAYSRYTDRSDAYHCAAGFSGYDPGLGSPNGSGRALLCPDLGTLPFGPAPRSTARGTERYTLFDSAGPLPVQPGPPVPPGHGQILAFARGSGGICSWAVGATRALGHMRLNYDCSPGGAVYGFAYRSHQPWTALVWFGQPYVTPQLSQLVPVRVLEVCR